MADQFTWSINGDIGTEFRRLTGRKTTGQLSNAEVNKWINDYYVNFFSGDAKVDEFDTFFTQALSATDDGEYSLSQDVDRIDDPVTINGAQIELFRDRELFFGSLHATGRHFHNHFHFRSAQSHHLGSFRDFEQFITDPNLVIGTVNAARVKHDAFDYRVQDFSFSKATSEVALTGSDIPEDKYGAWSFKIDSDGDITVAAATANATGYDTPRKALDVLTVSDSTTAYMGYVTVMKSDGAFTPDTTLLSAANVTATFTDGVFESRATPVAALLFGQKLFVGPKPNDIYQFKAIQVADRPTALEDGVEIADAKWGRLIATNSALFYLNSIGDQTRIDELSRGSTFFNDAVEQDKIKRLLGQKVQRRF